MLEENQSKIDLANEIIGIEVGFLNSLTTLTHKKLESLTNLL